MYSMSVNVWRELWGTKHTWTLPVVPSVSFGFSVQHLPSRRLWWSRATDASVWSACLCQGTEQAESSCPVLRSESASQAWCRGRGGSGEGVVVVDGMRRCKGRSVSYFLTPGLFSVSFLTPCSWILLMWWYLGNLPPLQRTITEDSKKCARLCSRMLSSPQQSHTVSSQLTFRFLEKTQGPKKQMRLIFRFTLHTFDPVSFGFTLQLCEHTEEL